MDSGIVAAMIFLDLLAVSELSVSEFTRKYIRYITLEETNFRIADPKGMIEMLVSEYQDETQDTMDGLTVSYVDGSWWNVR
jgi:phosphomannomutase